MKATFLPCEDSKATFMNPKFTKATFMNLASGRGEAVGCDRFHWSARGSG